LKSPVEGGDTGGVKECLRAGRKGARQSRKEFFFAPEGKEQGERGKKKQLKWEEKMRSPKSSEVVTCSSKGRKEHIQGKEEATPRRN